MQPLGMDRLTSKGVETHRVRTSDLEHHFSYPWEVAQNSSFSQCQRCSC